jgi:hypothetical protein
MGELLSEPVEYSRWRNRRGTSILWALQGRVLAEAFVLHAQSPTARYRVGAHGQSLREFGLRKPEGSPMPAQLGRSQRFRP